MQEQGEFVKEQRRLLQNLVYNLMLPDTSDLQAFEVKAEQMIRRWKTVPDDAIADFAPAMISQLRRWLREQSESGVMRVLREMRSQLMVELARSSVPIVAAVVTTSVIWENGYRLDHVVVPSATREHPELTLAELVQQLPAVIVQTLMRLGEAGLDEVRQNEAYPMDSVKFEELMGVLDSYIGSMEETRRHDYETIVQRMRMLLQVLTEDDLRVG